MSFRQAFKLIVASVALMLMAFPVRAQVVFQADFNGSGTGTGETSNIVTYGGTASLASVTNMSAGIGTSPVLLTGAPGFLHLNDTDATTGTAGASITPKSAAQSMDSWYVDGGATTFDTINGGFDFYFRSSVASSTWDGTGGDFRPIDLSGGHSGLRLIVNAPTINRLQLELIGYNSAGTAVQNLITSTSPNIAANTLYHLAVTVTTNATGYVTINLFLAQGDVPINTASNAYLVASTTSTTVFDPPGTNAITHAFNSTSGYTFGQADYASPHVKTIDFGSFRIYNAVPNVFPTVQYLPDLPVANNPKPNPEPTSWAPGATFDLFSPPVVAGGAAGSNTPAGSEWTRTANAGEGMIVAGNQLSTYTGTDVGKDSAFQSFGENGSSLNNAPADISREQGNNAAIQLDTSLPTDSVYLVWPINANGYGTPMIVNKAEAWWIGANIVGLGSSTSTPAGMFAPGSPVSLYGRNLTSSISGSASSTSYIYIKPQGNNSGQWVTPTSANPYKVDFTIPGTLASGTTYEVWAHNGHGGHYGWAGPVLLTLGSVSTWSGSTFNVPAPTGNATTDTANIQTALTEAAEVANSTVALQSGTYVATGFDLPPNIRLNGVSPTATTLEFPSTATGGCMIGLPGTSANITVSNLAIESNNSWNTYLINGYAYPEGTGTMSQVSIVNCLIDDAGLPRTPIPSVTTTASAFSSGATTLSLSSTTNVAAGQILIGVGIPGYDKISSVSGTTVTLSAATTASESSEPVTVLTAMTTTASTFASGATTLTVTSAAGMQVNQVISGTGIPGNDTIAGISGTTITLSAATTGPSAGTTPGPEPVSTSGTAITTASSFAKGATSITVTSSSGLQVGGGLTGAGLPTGEFISSISGTSVGLSLATSAATTASEPVTMAANPLGNPGEGEVYFDVCNQIYFQGDTIIGGGLPIIDATECAFDHCVLAGAYDGGEFNVKGNSSEMSYTNCSIQDYDNYMGYTFTPTPVTGTGPWSGGGYYDPFKDPLQWGWCQGPFFKGLDDDGARHNTYLGNNTSYNMGMRTAASGVWGEQISFEQGWGQYAGTPTATTSTSMTFNNLTSVYAAARAELIAGGDMGSSSPMAISTATPPLTPLIAVIINGTGEGQWRDVGGINTSTGLVTLAAGESWNVPPDTTSTVAIGWYEANVVSYENNFTGKQERVGTSELSITGFLPYGGVMNAIVDSNTYNYAAVGANVVALQPRDTTVICVMPDYFHLYINNVMFDCQENLSVASGATAQYTNTLLGAYDFGHVFRGNTGRDAIAGDTNVGISISPSYGGCAKGLDMLLFEDNSFIGMGGAVNLQEHGDFPTSTQGNLLFENNVFSLGSATSAAISAADALADYSGSYGINCGNGTLIGMGGNVWTSFGSNYVDGPPGALLEEPIRTFSESASVALGVPVTDTVTVWNSGTSSLSWSASSDSTWLTVAPATGTGPVEDRPDPSSFVITCNPTVAGTGPHTGNVTLTCGSQTKKVLVNFMANP